MASHVARPATVEDVDERGQTIAGTRATANRAAHPGDTASHVSTSAQTFVTLASADSAKVLPRAPEPPTEKVAAATPPVTAPEAAAPVPGSPEKKHKRSGSKTSKKSSSHKIVPVHQYDGMHYPVYPPMATQVSPPTHQYFQPGYEAQPYYSQHGYPQSPPAVMYDPAYGVPMHHYATAPQSPVDYPYVPQYAAAYAPAPLPVIAPAPAPAPLDYDGMPPPALKHRRRPMSFHAGMHVFPRDHYDPYAYQTPQPFFDAYATQSQDYFGLHPTQKAVAASPPERRAIKSSKSHRRSYIEPGLPDVTYASGREDPDRRRMRDSPYTEEAPRSRRSDYEAPRRRDSDTLQLPSETRSSRPIVKHTQTDPYRESVRKPSKESRNRAYTVADTREALAAASGRDYEYRERRSHRADDNSSSRRPSRATDASSHTRSSGISPGHATAHRSRDSHAGRPSSYYDVANPSSRSRRDSKDAERMSSAEEKAEEYMNHSRGGKLNDELADVLRQPYQGNKQPGLIQQKAPTVMSRSSSSKNSHGHRSSELTGSSTRHDEVKVTLEFTGRDGRPEWQEYTVPNVPNGRVSIVLPERDEFDDRDREQVRDRERERKRVLPREGGSRRASSSVAHRHERSSSLSSRLSRLAGFSRSGRSRVGSSDGSHDDVRSRRRSSVRTPIYEDSPGERHEERRERRRAS